ncbi:unnamed protein product [Ceratitis capitata]|uniref:(Mediterranean fruit fly) hypothetical protein n=1 Tax=Ceratitis capitata TaxID=7213 RepID=A0A811UE41_CERCA|nr:unnamed protein product [Ceratitis capitata]
MPSPLKKTGELVYTWLLCRRVATLHASSTHEPSTSKNPALNPHITVTRASTQSGLNGQCWRLDWQEAETFWQFKAVENI